MTRHERGASTLEYVGVLALVAVLATGVLFAFPNMASDIRGAVSTAVCQITGGDCDPAESASSTTNEDTEEPGVGAKEDDSPRQPPPDPPHDSNGDELSGPYDQDRVTDALDLIDDYLDTGFCLWPFCRRPNLHDIARDLDGLSQAELQAVFDQLSDDELRRLLGPPGLGSPGNNDMQQFVLENAPMDTIRRLMGMDPPYFTTDYSAVGNSDAQNSEYGEIPGATLYGPNDSIDLSDIDQGMLSNCWFMASMGMMTQSEEGQQMIRDMITENPNGTFTVTFPDGAEVTVTPDFPLRSANGGTTFAGVGNPPTLWPAVLEEAAAQRHGGYDQLEVNSVTYGIEFLTGESASSHGTDSLSVEDLQRMHDNGEAIAFLTPPSEDAEGPLYGDSAPAGERLTAFHFYVVESVDDDGTVTLYNPQGHSHRQVAYEDIDQHFRDIQSVNLTG